MFETSNLMSETPNCDSNLGNIGNHFYCIWDYEQKSNDFVLVYLFCNMFKPNAQITSWPIRHVICFICVLQKS